jgi:viroplasmin and RNaseH domain-containing protein
MLSKSKPLGFDDTSGFNFSKEMLDGDATSAINFDRLQNHPEKGYIIFEYLLCDEKQTVNPYTSHPRRYWSKNSKKFISLWNASKDLNAILYLVNYAKKDTVHEDKILLIKVLDLDENGVKNEEITKMSREKFKKFFKKLNKECLN